MAGLVIVYTMPGCHFCELTKLSLRTRGIAFAARDVTARPEHEAEARRHSVLAGTGFPVVVAGEQVWCGHRPDFIRKLEAGS